MSRGEPGPATRGRDERGRLLIESALVLLVQPDPCRVLLGLRAEGTRFFPGHWAFPGGRLEREDREGASSFAAALRRCAQRELLEEAGVALAFEELEPIGERITPPFHPRRYRTAFHLAIVDELALPAAPPQPEELTRLELVAPEAALAEWSRGERPMPPPLPPLLRRLVELERRGALERATLSRELARVVAEEERLPRIELAPGCWLVPQETWTLPPATHTNAWLVGGRRFLVVDPGSDDPDELARLAASVARREREEGHRAEAIVLTHHHGDHVAGARVLGDELRLPLRAHAETRARLERLAPFGADLVEGERFELEGASARVLHTPGHAPGHVALLLESSSGRQLVAGDLVSALSTILVPPEEGRMEDFVASLERVHAEAPDALVLPSHGPPLPASALARAAAHRREREALVESALGERPRPLDEIAAEAYAGHPSRGSRLARSQSEAHLLALARAGRAERVGAGAWRRARECR